MGRVIVLTNTLTDTLLRADVWVLRVCARTARPTIGRALAIGVSWVGNGGFYPLLAAALVIGFGWRSCVAIVIAAINMLLMHSVYPTIKRRTARARPFHSHRDLTPLLAALDEHSFPSGHIMTLTAALVPVTLALPATFPLAVGTWVAMAWARLASAHHYPSDVLAGAMLALVVSYPLSKIGLNVSAFG